MNGLAGLDPRAVTLAVGLAALVLVSAVAASALLSRRKLRREIRELVSALEGMRGGRRAPRADVPDDSPLGMVADAVHRLGQEVAARAHEAGRTATQYEALLAAAPDTAVVSTDADGGVRTFNDAAEELFGWPATEIQGRPASTLFPEDAWKDLLPKLLRREMRSRGLRTRATLRRQDGATFEAELFVRHLRHDGAEGAGFLVAVRDVDERVRLERRLALVEARHREFLERLGEAVVVVRDGRVGFANPAAAALLEREPETLAGAAFRDLVPTREVLRVREWLAAVESGAAADDGLSTAVETSGGEIRVRMRAAPVEHDGRPAVLAVLADETATRRIESELRRNEARLDAVLEASTDGVVVLAETGGRAGAVVQLTNGAFADLFGVPVDAVLGAGEGAFLGLLRERGGGAEAVARLIASSGGEAIRETVAFEDEPAREIDVRCAPLRDRAGRVVGRLVACRDLTAVRLPERRLEENTRELRASLEGLRRERLEAERKGEDLRARAEGLERFNRELRQLDAMKSQLLANVSHELQTPLVSIRGYTEMISKGRLGPVTDEQRRGLDLSLRNIDRLISMIDGLLEFSRMEREIGDLELTEFDLADLVEECRATLEPRLAEKGLAWTTRIDDPAPTIRADRDKIRQVFLNVAGNAVKFNRPGGRVEIVVGRKDASHARVEIRDTGPGIAPEDLDRVFERFYRAGDGPAAEAPGGTGLGLAIVRNLLRLHGCSVRADSRPGEGATFTFTLPLAGRDDLPAVEDDPDASDASAAPAVEEDAAPVPAPPASAPRPDSRDGRDRPRLRIIRR